jgi:hypothetical protein
VGGDGAATIEQRMTGRAESAGEAVRSIRIAPRSELAYRAGGRAGETVVFRATLSPIATARGDAVVRIVSGGKVLLERQVAASQEEAEAISVELPPGETFTIRVSFGRQLLFPSGVVLGDPHLVAG